MDVQDLLKDIISKLGLNYVDPARVICVRSKGTKSAYVHARCWSLPRIWQEALNQPAKYIIEVIGEKYDNLSISDRKMLLIHELLHIPKSFSGALRPHKGYVNNKVIKELYSKLEKAD